MAAAQDESWDPPKQCSAFSPWIDQGDCNSCCAAAVAISVGVRTCMRDHRDTVFQAQRIWDCAGSTATCRTGVNINAFVDELISSPGAGRILALDGSNRIQNATVEPNSDRCHAATDNATALQFSSSHAAMWNSDAGVQDAEAVMMSEIRAHGPVVAILRLPNSTFSRFAEWHSHGEEDAVFWPYPLEFKRNATYPMPLMSDGEPMMQHCISVYGWGVDKSTGLRYWRVQNSFGYRWGHVGRGNIPRGLGWIEPKWYAFESAVRPCVGQECLTTPPPAVSAVIVIDRVASSDVAVITILSLLALSAIFFFVYSYVMRRFCGIRDDDDLDDDDSHEVSQLNRTISADQVPTPLTTAAGLSPEEMFNQWLHNARARRPTVMMC